MFNKMRRILQNESGLSIVFVLCIGALFIAMTTAVLYGASSLEASANQVISQEDAYIMARSFADTVEQQLTDTSDTPNSLKTFIRTDFFSGTYFDDKDYAFVYNEDHAASTAPQITLALNKEKLDGQELPDGTKTGVPVAGSDSLTPGDIAETILVSDYQNPAGDVQAPLLAATLQTFNAGGCDYQLTVTITVETGGKSFSIVRKFERYPVLQAYYQINGERYTYQGTGIQLTRVGNATTISLADDAYKNARLEAYYRYKNSVPGDGSIFKRIGGEDNA